MNASERDELLSRIDQKVRDSLPRIEGSLEKINVQIDTHSLAINTHKIKQDERLKPSKKSIAGWVSGAAALAAALWKAFLGS